MTFYARAARSIGLTFLLLLTMSLNVCAQGPFSAQIQRALDAFIKGTHTWAATQTFTNIVINGSCTGCGSSALPITRVTSPFNKTSSVVLANITGLTQTVSAGQTYAFETILYTTSGAGGIQFAIAGTATATAIIYEGQIMLAGQSSTNGPFTSRATALGAAILNDLGDTTAYVRITGTITVNAGGTLTVQFAQALSDVATSSVLVGSTFAVALVP